MINEKQHLSEKIFKKTIDMSPTRQGYGEGLVIAGENNEKVVVLCADLTDSTKSNLFKEKFPKRFIEVGVAEQGMATIAAGMANYGKIPFISSYAAFSPGRNWEQIRTTIALNDVPVKIAGAHTGVSVGPDGATHQMLEDIALMRAMPNMIVVATADAIESKKATIEAAKNDKPTYLRFTREKTPMITTAKTPFSIGKAEIFRKGKDVSIIACGPLVYQSLIAAQELAKYGIDCEVINNHTIKPLDSKTLLASVRKTKCVVTIEEHQLMAGAGSAVCELFAQKYPVPIEMVGMQDAFGESGTPSELLEKYGMSVKAIKAAVRRVLRRK